MRSPLTVDSKRSAALAVAWLAALGCADFPTASPPPSPVQKPTAQRVLGIVQIKLSVVGPGEVRASANHFRPLPTGPAGARFTLSPVNENGVGGVLFEPLPGAGSFTHGPPGAGGYRYLFMTGKVRNAGTTIGGDTVAHTSPRTNLTIIATAVPSGGGFSGIPGTPFADLAKFDGTPAASSIASGILPTGAVKQTLTGGISTHSADVLQVFTEDEVATLAPSYDAFPYGYVVRHATLTSTRTLAANPGPNQYDGFITLGLKIPLQANPADDVYGFSMFFVLVDDTETKITQSIEEQDAAGQTAFDARVGELSGLTRVTVLPGGNYGGSLSVPVRRMCRVRVAGTAASPTAFLDGSSANSCPTLTAVSPNSGIQGTTASVTLTGTNFVTGAGATTVAVSGTGITVNNVVVNIATSLTADFVIASSATAGARTVTVTTATGTSASKTFTVLAAGVPAPTLTSISPSSGQLGNGVSVTLTGTNFVNGGTTIAVSGSGVDIVSPTFVSSTQLTAIFGIQPSAATGARSVTVTTSGGTSGAVTFTINP